MAHLTFTVALCVQDGLHRGRRRPRRSARQRRDLPRPAVLEVRPGRQQQLKKGAEATGKMAVFWVGKLPKTLILKIYIRFKQIKIEIS